jgi:hypothetical protein
MENEIMSLINSLGLADLASNILAGITQFIYLLILAPIILIAFYIYLSICWQKIGEKLNHPYPWIGWVMFTLIGGSLLSLPLLFINTWMWVLLFVPMAQFVPEIALIQFSDSPWWWYFLLWIPIVNIILVIIMLTKVYEKLDRPSWWSIFYLVPIVHLILLGIAAFTEEEGVVRYSHQDDYDEPYHPQEHREEPKTAYQGTSSRSYGVLVIIDGINKGQSFRLTPGSTNVIGRAGNIQLPIDDRTASREHARIRDENGKYVLYDLGSTNKTYVNNQFSDRKVLMDGDVIKTGRTKFRFGWIRSK